VLDVTICCPALEQDFAIKEYLDVASNEYKKPI